MSSKRRGRLRRRPEAPFLLPSQQHITAIRLTTLARISLFVIGTSERIKLLSAIPVIENARECSL